MNALMLGQETVDIHRFCAICRAHKIPATVEDVGSGLAYLSTWVQYSCGRMAFVTKPFRRAPIESVARIIRKMVQDVDA